MLFIGQNQVNLALLNPANPTGGRKYSGDDEIQAMIAHKWAELADKYAPDEIITFVRPHMKSGVGGGAMGGAYQRAVHINTRNGTKIVTWCDQAIERSKGFCEFIPKIFKHTPEQPLALMLSRDIDQILWHCLFDKLRERPYTYPQKDAMGRPHPKAGRQVPGIYILDPEDDAADFLRKGEKSSAMWFYLMAEDSPLHEQRDKINLLASAWGISRPEEKKLPIIKRMLIEAIESAEARNDTEYGYKAFADAVKNVLSGDDTMNTETLALINRALDRGIIKYMSSRLAWYLVGENGTEIKRLCQVSSVNVNKSKEVLMAHLLKDDEDMTLIQGSVEAKPIEEKVARRVYIPQPPTQEFFEKEMKFPKMKRVCILLGIDHVGKTKAQLTKVMIDYFITQGKTLPPENLLEEPEDE